MYLAVNKNSQEESLSAETDWLIRILVLWRDWNVLCPETNYLGLSSGPLEQSFLATLCIGTKIL